MKYTKNFFQTHKYMSLFTLLVLMPSMALGQQAIKWKIQNTGGYDLNDVHFVDKQHGWVTGGDVVGDVNLSIVDEIETTSDGGSSWMDLKSGSYPDIDILNAVHFVDKKKGWIVGDEGKVLHTTNGGNDWTEQFTGYSYGGFYSVYFVDTQTGWVVGNDRNIRYTADGGNNWTMQENNVNVRGDVLYSVYFIDDQTGWVVGYRGTILHTTDGGTSWNQQNSPTDKDLKSVHFVDSQTGWAVADSGIVIKTTDGGNNWKKLSTGTDADLESIHFVDAQTGWTVGDTILHTNNGGNTWTMQSYDTSTYLKSVHFVDAKTGWAVGGDGTILTYGGGEGSTSISENTLNQSNNLTIYPNPAQNQLKLQTQIQSQTYTLHTLTGRKAQSGKVSGKGTHTLDVSNLSPGVYLLKVHGDDFVRTKKVVVK